MDTHLEVRNWAENMSYSGKIPNSLENICNASTIHIWMQLIEKVKPAKDVRKIRNNFLIQGIKNSSRTEHSHLQMREFELWKKKHKLKEELENVHEHIKDGHRKINDLSSRNKQDYIIIENLRQVVKENDQKSFLLSCKSKKTKRDMTKSEEKLTYCRDMLPFKTNQSKQEVLSALNKSSQKIKKSIEAQTFNTCKVPAKTPSAENSKTFEDNLLDSLGCVRTFDGTFMKNELVKFDLSGELDCFKIETFLHDAEDILHSNDNFLLWTNLMELIENLKYDLTNCINNKDTLTENSKLEGNSEIVTLLGVHIMNELLALKCEKDVRSLQKMLSKQEHLIFTGLEKLDIDINETEAFKTILLLQKEEAGLNALCKCMNDQAEQLKTLTGVNVELMSAKNKLLNVQQLMVKNIQRIGYKSNLLKKAYLSLTHAREESFMFAHKLNQFTGDLLWSLPLINGICSKEINIFKQFHVEYNRQTCADGMQTYRRNFFMNDVFNGEDLDANSLYVMSTLINKPFSPPETMLLDLIHDKIKFSIFQSLQTGTGNLNWSKYDFEELRRQESYLDYAMNELIALMRPHSTNKILSIAVITKNIVKLWLEMPVKNFVSPKRLFNNNGVEKYQDLYEFYYDKLQ